MDVNNDRTTIEVDDLVTVGVRAKLTRPGTATMVLLDLGVPPGFTVQADEGDGAKETAAMMTNRPGCDGSPAFRLLTSGDYFPSLFL